MQIETLITDLSHAPFSPELNFQVACEYHAMGQLASAISFYLRTAEYGEKTSYAYVSLIKAALCFETQTNRQATVENLLMKAIAHNPSEPIAYFYLSRFYERTSKWQEAYTYASIGLSNSVTHLADYFPDYRFDFISFEQAVAAWWIGRKDEAIDTFHTLLAYPLPQEYIDAIRANLDRIQ